MKRFSFALVLCALAFAGVTFSDSACAADRAHILKVYNWADYIDMDNVLNTFGLELAKHLLHTAGFELENGVGIAGREDFCKYFFFKRNFLDVNAFSGLILNIFQGFGDNIKIS